jgi:signal transduction histidine kinase
MVNQAFDRVLLARHFALSLGAVAAYVFRSELRIGYVALWIVGVSATLNFLAYAFRTRPGMSLLCTVASPMIGIGGWSALIGVTAGVHSPFIAGLWIEVGLSAMALNLREIVWVTVGSVVALWVQQVWLSGIEGEGLPTLLQSGFLVGMGAATFLVTRRWAHQQTTLREELDGRLDLLTRQLEDERVVAALGGNVARLAHGLKNTVHSLRGFVALIEPKLDRDAGSAAVEGLRAAIDDLEALAHLTLGSDTSSDVPPAESQDTAARATISPTGSGALGAVERAIVEISTSHPDVAWELKSDGRGPALSISEASLVEILVILLRNGVEAMAGRGGGSVETWESDGEFYVVVCDEGGGFEIDDPDQIFKPGYTTKAQGSGYGLFLARRILEEHGGQITLRAREGKGAAVELRLPVVPARTGVSHE